MVVPYRAARLYWWQVAVAADAVIWGGMGSSDCQAAGRQIIANAIGLSISGIT